MESNKWSRNISINISSIFSPSLLLAASAAMLVGGTIGVIEPSLKGVVIGLVIMVVVLALRQDELAITIIMAVQLYADWYLGIAGITQVLAPLLLLFFYLTRSPRYPWMTPRALWLWILFLVLALFPALRGLTFRDGIYYYLNIIFNALIIFWLGLVIGRDVVRVRRFLSIYSFFGTLIAVHAIIQAATGIFLFKTTFYDPYLVLVASNFELGTSNVFRVGSFLINPDSGGAFFATMLFLPLGLFVASSSLLEKVLYLSELSLILLALLFTYSTGGWIPAVVAFFIFIALVGRAIYRVMLPLFTAFIAVAIASWFPSQVNLLLQHAAAPDELRLRLGAWQTGIRVIEAFPLTGIGLGRYVYFERAEPYRVPAQFIPLYHPHNSYLELAALGGLPFVLIFLALLSGAIWLALRNWAWADASTRAMLGGAIAAIMSFSINSLVNPGWTLPPLAATGWMILGVVSSPLLAKSLVCKMRQEASQTPMHDTDEV